MKGGVGHWVMAATQITFPYSVAFVFRDEFVQHYQTVYGFHELQIAYHKRERLLLDCWLLLPRLSEFLQEPPLS